MGPNQLINRPQSTEVTAFISMKHFSGSSRSSNLCVDHIRRSFGKFVCLVNLAPRSVLASMKPLSGKSVLIAVLELIWLKILFLPCNDWVEFLHFWIPRTTALRFSFGLQVIFLVPCPGYEKRDRRAIQNHLSLTIVTELVQITSPHFTVNTRQFSGTFSSHKEYNGWRCTVYWSFRKRARKKERH